MKQLELPIVKKPFRKFGDIQKLLLKYLEKHPKLEPEFGVPVLFPPGWETPEKEETFTTTDNTSKGIQLYSENITFNLKLSKEGKIIIE